jgi:hypothetical protein
MEGLGWGVLIGERLALELLGWGEIGYISLIKGVEISLDSLMKGVGVSLNSLIKCTLLIVLRVDI